MEQMFLGASVFNNDGSTTIGNWDTSDVSIMTQMFGLFFINISSLIVFLLETIPFIMALIYLRKNIRFMSKFTSFLLTFFVIYSTIWLLGNDNLGTAVRLRIPSYMVIFASMLIVYQTKIVAGYEKIKGRRV